MPRLTLQGTKSILEYSWCFNCSHSQQDLSRLDEPCNTYCLRTVSCAERSNSPSLCALSASFADFHLSTPWAPRLHCHADTRLSKAMDPTANEVSAKHEPSSRSSLKTMAVYADS